MSIKAQPVRIEQRPHLRQYSLANCTVEVIADCDAAMQIWQSFAQRYCQTECPAKSYVQTIGTIELYGQSNPPELPPAAKGERITHGYYWTQGDAVWLDIAGTIIFINLNLVQVWLCQNMGQSTSELDWMMSYALPGILRRRGFYELHAAGLIAPENGQGILLIGDSGSGKSTLTTQLAKSGWSYLSDDLLMLQQTEKVVAAWGLRRVFALTQQTMNICLPNQTQGTFNANAEKYFLEPDKIFPTAPATNCQPQSLFFVELTHQMRTRIEPITSSTAMMGLLRQSSWLCYDPTVAMAHTKVLTQLTQQCQAFRLLAGQDLLLRPALADTLLRGYLT